MNEYVPSTFIISGSKGTPNICGLAVSLTSQCSVVSNLWGLGDSSAHSTHNLHRRRTLPFTNMTLHSMPPAIIPRVLCNAGTEGHFVNPPVNCSRRSEIGFSY